MRRLIEIARTRVALVAVGGALLLTGVGFGAAAATGDPAPREVAEVGDQAATSTEPSAPTTTATESRAPGDTPTASIDTVIPDAPAPVDAPAPAPAPAPASAAEPEPAETPGEYDPTAPFTDEAGQTYLPGPDVPAPSMPPPGD